MLNEEGSIPFWFLEQEKLISKLRKDNENQNVLFGRIFSAVTVLTLIVFGYNLYHEPIAALSGLSSLLLSLAVQNNFGGKTVFIAWIVFSCIPLWSFTVVSFLPLIIALFTLATTKELSDIEKLLNDLDSYKYKLKSA